MKIVFLLVFFLVLNVYAKDKKELVVYMDKHNHYEKLSYNLEATISLLNKKLPSYNFKILPIPFSDIKEVKKLLSKKKIDFLFTRPLITYELLYTNRISTILTIANKYHMSKFGSVFIVNKNSSINNIKDIKGKKVVAVNPSAFSGWLVGYGELYKNGVDPIKDRKVTFVGSHKSVIESILNNKYDVGVIRSGMFEEWSSELDISKLKVINKQKIPHPIQVSTKMYPEWSFSKAEHIDVHLANKVFKILNNIESDSIEAIKGKYYHWHLPESHIQIDRLFKNLKLGRYKDFGGFDKTTVYKVFVGTFFIIFILVIMILVYMKIRFEKKSKYLVQRRLDETEAIARIGHWSLDLNKDVAEWSSQMFNIFGFLNIPKQPGPKLAKAFIYEEDIHILEESLVKIRVDLTKKHNVVYRIHRADNNETRWISCIGVFNKETQRLEGTLQDITDFKNIEFELNQQKELLMAQSKAAVMGEMISLIAHQWKQPISVISMVANNIKTDIALEDIKKEALEDYTKELHKQVEYLSKTIDTFKNFFSPNKSKEDCSILETIENALSFLSSSLSSNNIEIIKNYNKVNDVYIISDELVQVLMNLINNSKDAFVINNILNKKLFISIYQNGNVIIEIEDTAGGIPEDKIDKIFDAYITTKKEGTGLGLYIVKEIIESHFKGTIEVQNTDEGAKFTISIPKNLTDLDK